MPDTSPMVLIKKEIKSTFSLSVPLISSQLVYACSGFIGTALIAQLGEEALAASVLVSSIWMTLSVFFFGVLNSVSVLVSHQHGAKDCEAISHTMGQAYFLGALISFIIIFLLSTATFFLHLTTQPPTVLHLAIQSIHALTWTVPSLILLIIYEQFLAGVNHARIVLRISLLVVPIEIPLIYLLIFGRFGFPACGIAGIGYGFAITYTATAIAMTFYLSLAKQFQRFHLFKTLNQFRWNQFKELIRLGAPMGFVHITEVGTFAVVAFWVARFGTTMLAAHQIVMQYLGFVITIVFAMSQAVTIRVGHAIGKQNIEGVRRAVYVGMGLNFICITFISTAFLLFPQFFLSLDINVHAPINALLIQNGSTLLGIAGVLLLFDNFRIIGFGALRGMKDTRVPMYLTLFTFGFIGLGLSFILGFVFNLGPIGIWWGMTLGIASGAALNFWRAHYMINKLASTTTFHSD